MDKALLLKKHNLKSTPQRLKIVDLLFINGHMNIDELYTNLKEIFPSISLSTIYKNINTMIEKGFLLELKVPNEKNVYELAKLEHSHLVCIVCKEVLDIELNTVELLQKAKKVSNYTLDKSSIILNGTCPKCLV